MLADTLDKVASYELMDAPIGGGATLAIADALGKALMELVGGFINIPEIITGLGLSILDRKYLKLEKYLGEKVDTLMNLSLCRTAIDSQIDLSGKIEELISKVLPKKSSEQTTSGIEDFGFSGIDFGTSLGSISSEPIGEISNFSSFNAPEVKVADVLELRKKRIQAYTE